MRATIGMPGVAAMAPVALEIMPADRYVSRPQLPQCERLPSGRHPKLVFVLFLPGFARIKRDTLALRSESVDGSQRPTGPLVPNP
jgi:hypothetical protein